MTQGVVISTINRFQFLVSSTFVNKLIGAKNIIVRQVQPIMKYTLKICDELDGIGIVVEYDIRHIHWILSSLRSKALK